MGTAPNIETVAQVKEGRKRRYRSKQERRRIVEETLKPGASVSLVARAHDVNTNQVFKWRKQYLQGGLEIEAPRLLPVKVAEAIQEPSPALGRKSRTRRSGIIDIDLGHARVRIEGAADPDCVRAALEGLVR
jgi:transposase